MNRPYSLDLNELNQDLRDHDTVLSRPVRRKSDPKQASTLGTVRGQAPFSLALDSAIVKDAAWELAILRNHVRRFLRLSRLARAETSAA